MGQPIETVYVSYFDWIDGARVTNLMGICSGIVTKHKPKRIYLLFSSSGGFVDASITLYNFLRSLPVKLVMHNIGVVESAATVVFLAADVRLAGKYSSFLFHGLKWTFPMATELTFPQLQEVLSKLRQGEDKMAGLIVERSRLSESEVRELFHQGESKDVQFAMDNGFIQEIKEAVIPKDALHITVNFK